MSFFCDRYEMLELFDSEVIIDEEVDIAIYKVTDENNLSLSVYFSPYDGDVGLILTQKGSKRFIYELGLSKIEKVQIDRGIPGEIRLIFFKENLQSSLVTVMIKPEISLSCDI